jgi:hypothetical protein
MSVSTLTKAIDAMEISLRELRDALALALAATPEAPPLALAATPETPPLAPAATPEQTPAEPKKKGANAWNALISQTVADMKQNGWESFCDSSQPPVLWPASRMDGENYVYDGGEHDGKPPTQARGGMVRASYLKSLSDPAAKAKAEAHRLRRSQEIQKRAAAKAASESESEATLAGGGSVESKKKRKPLTEEQKAAAKAKRQAKKEAKKEAAKPTTTIDYPTWWPGAADF